jgi:hypothetical protein
VAGRERENCVRREGDWWWFGGSVMNGKKWTIMMTKEHCLVLKEKMDRKWNTSNG